MPGIVASPGRDCEDAERLLALAVSRPREALDGGRALLTTRPSPLAASMARQAIGIVLRDLGQLGPAIREFRLALRRAREAADSAREADVLASLGVALTMAGRTDEGLAAFEVAAARSEGRLLARVMMRRGGILSMLGRHRQALEDLDIAVTVLRGSADESDRSWEARALLTRAMSFMALGMVARADVDSERAEHLFAAAGQDLESAMAMHNRGLVAYHSGNLPVALAYLAQAENRYLALDYPAPELAQERCDVLLAAGLPHDALREVDAALGRGAAASKRADLLFSAASAALAAGEPVGARVSALQARRLFHAQGRDWWTVRAELVSVQARYSTGVRDARLLADSSAVARRLETLRAEEASVAHLLAGRLAAEAGATALADRHLSIAAQRRRRGPALTRATGWLAEALRHQTAGRRGGVTRACARGLDALDEHRLTLGGAELRALSTGHGRELASLVLRDAVSRGDARGLLRWSERWRATALAAPPVRPPEDVTLATDLAALRDAVRRLNEARIDGTPTAALERERSQWESAVRRRRHFVAGSEAETARFDPAQLLDELGETRLLELVEVDGTIHALVAAAGRVHRFVVGPVEKAEREVEFARFTLRRFARGQRADLGVVGARLEAALIGPAAARLGSGPVLVVPPGRLHAVPWALLPTLADRPVGVSPSAALWLHARRGSPPALRRTTLVLGPGLGTAGAEVAPLADMYPDAQLLRGHEAVVERVLGSLEGAWLAHVAAHGDFRSDSPLFSCLYLDDGPLTVYDLERLQHAPYRIVLSACDSGVAAPVGADELLGLVSGLLPLGTAGILASVVLVNDEATVPFMLAVHRSLQRGRGLPEALLDARLEARGDSIVAATAASFLALGV